MLILTFEIWQLNRSSICRLPETLTSPHGNMHCSVQHGRYVDAERRAVQA
jgi:hypothetical protein